MRPLPRNVRIPQSLLALFSLLVVLVTTIPSAFSVVSGGAAPSVGATGNDPRPFPRTFHIWGGDPFRFTKYDLVIGYPSWDLGALRAANPGAIYLANPMLDPFNRDWTRRKGTAVTYGSADEFTGATDSLVDGSAANLGYVPAWNTYWDTLHRPDGTIAPVSDVWKHEGWNLTRTDTSEKVAKITAYAAKLSKIYANGWDGIWSDNWVYRIGASWFYGENLDTNRDGVVDNIDLVQSRWWDGLTLVGNRLRSYLPGKIVGGNGAHQVWGLVVGSDPDGPYKSTNIAMNEVLEYWLSVKKPETVVSEAQSYLDFPDPLGMSRYFLLMHRLPGGQGDYRSMRAGFSLATIAGAYYEPYAVDHDDAFSYDEFTGGSIGRRGWLGQPVTAPTKLANGVWRRDFQNGVVLHNSTPSAQTVALGGSYTRLKGSQDPTVNNGAAVTSVTVPAGDGLFLAGSSGSSTSPPTNTAPPTVSGTPASGETLTASTGSWSGSPTSYTYQWQRCDSAGANCAKVATATSASYALTAVDVGSTLRVRVTATNDSGSVSAVSAPSGVVKAASSFVTTQSIAEGSTLSATVNWSASAVGKTVSKVDFSVDGNLVATDASAPFSTTLDTTKLANGIHTFAAKATAVDGTTAAASANANVSNEPAVAVPSFGVAQNLSQGQTLTGSLPWTATPSGTKTAARVEFFIDGRLSWTERYAPYVYAGDGGNLDTLKLADGGHTLSVKAFATDGTNASANAAVNVLNKPPVTPPTSFTVSQSVADGQTLTGSVSWTADAVGKTVRRVEFSVDGRLSWTENYAPYVYAGDGAKLDTQTLADGSHTLSVTAYATDGSTASATATVSVSNPKAPEPAPVLTLTSSIRDGSTITGSVSWTITPVGKDVSRMEFFVDDRLMWTERYAPWVYGGDGRHLDTSTLGRGRHTLMVKAYAADGTEAVLKLDVTVE